MAGPLALGIDFGTVGVRAGVFDAHGTPAAVREATYETAHPRQGWAEQDPEAWWAGLVEAVRGALGAGGVAPEDVAGISLDATSSTVVALDARGRALRPAILWMDVRAAEQAERIAATGHAALKYNGHGPVSAEWGLPKAMWLKEREPETWAEAARVCDCGDWAVNRLTGEWAGSVNMAASKYYFDRDAGGFPDDLFEALGIGDLLEKYPGDITDLGVTVGELRPEVAEELGLRAGTPVAQGGVDAYLGALALGVVEPGQLALITGSSHVLIAQSSEPVHDPGFWGAYTDAMFPGLYTIEAGQASTGTIVEWFARRFAGAAVEEATRRGVGAFDVLNDLARDVPIGAEGLVLLDFFQGNRSPYTDPLARGALWGLSLSHDVGHVFRAILEGICYGTELILRTMRAQGFEPTSIAATGGPTRSELWMQMHADVSDVPIALTRVGEGPVLGAAILAAVAGGMYPDVRSAVDGMVQVTRTIEPDAARHRDYAFFMERYVETYPALKDLMHATVRHVSGGGAAVAGGGDRTEGAG